MSEGGYPSYSDHPMTQVPDRAKWSDQQRKAYQQARADGWQDDLAALIAEGCPNDGVDAKIRATNAREILRLCRARCMPESAAADFVLLGHTPKTACEAMLAAGSNKSGLALQLWATRRFQNVKKRMH